MIRFLDVEYADPGVPFRPGPVRSPLTVEPPAIPEHVEAEIRVHVRAALARVGWPPEPADDNLETP